MSNDMLNISIEESEFTPSIILDTENGIIALKGNSLPENTFEFYKQFMENVTSYFESPQEKTTVNMEIIYFNSSSSKLFFDFFDLLEANQEKSEVVINWLYDEENESMEEAGEDFKEDFEDLTFNLVQK